LRPGRPGPAGEPRPGDRRAGAGPGRPAVRGAAGGHLGPEVGLARLDPTRPRAVHGRATGALRFRGVHLCFNILPIATAAMTAATGGRAKVTSRSATSGSCWNPRRT